MPRLIELTKTTLLIYSVIKINVLCSIPSDIHTIVQVLCDIISSQLWSVPGESLKKCEGPQKKFVPFCYILFCIYTFWLVVDYSILLHILFKISWMLDIQNWFQSSMVGQEVAAAIAGYLYQSHYSHLYRCWEL